MDDLFERISSLQDGNAWPSTIELINDLADRIEAQAAEIRSLRTEIERREYDGIHTCHDQCQRAACVLRRENEALREQVEQWAGCAMYDATMEGPVFKGWDRSALDRCRKRHENKD